MNYHDYVKYRCMQRSLISAATGIPDHKLKYKTCPMNLDYKQVEILKAIIGDWDTFEPTVPHVDQENK